MNIPQGTLELIIAGGAGLLLLIVLVLVWRKISVQSITDQDATIPNTGQARSAPAATPPAFEDLSPHIMAGKTGLSKGFSSQLQTPSHNLRIEQVNNRMIYTVDGVTYQRLEDIPEQEDLRKTIRRLQDKTFAAGNVNPEEELRQVQIGSQTTLEARSRNYTISIQSEGGSPRFIVNGLTYYHLNDIAQPELKQRARELLGKMM